MSSRVLTKPAGELDRGDVVDTEIGAAELIAAPFLGCTGASVFDRCALFWRARVCALADQRVFLMTWDVAESVALVPQTTGRSMS